MDLHQGSSPTFSLPYSLSSGSTKQDSHLSKVTQLVSGELGFQPSQSDPTGFDTSPPQTPQKTKHTRSQLSPLFLAARRLKPSALGERQHDSELKAQTALSSCFMFRYSGLLWKWEAWETGSPRPQFTPILLGGGISSSLLHFQQCLSLEVHYMAVLCIRHGSWVGSGEAQVI